MAIPITTKMSLLLLFVICLTSEGIWGCPRQPTPCVMVNCEWGYWGQWSTCSQKCGGGTMERKREIKVYAMCGGSACYEGNIQTQPCNEICYNGGVFFAGKCACPEDYFLWPKCCISNADLDDLENVGESCVISSMHV